MPDVALERHCSAIVEDGNSLFAFGFQQVERDIVRVDYFEYRWSAVLGQLDDWFGFAERNPVKQALILNHVVGGAGMQNPSIVPQYRVANLPFMTEAECRCAGLRRQFSDEFLAFIGAPSDDSNTDLIAKIERFPTTEWVAAHQGMDHLVLR